MSGTEESIGDLFVRAVEAFPDRPFLSLARGEARKRSTYGAAAVRVAATAEALARSGLRRGDRLLCYLDDADVLIHVSLACGALGIVVCPLAPVLSPKAVEHLALHVTPAAFLTTPDLAPRLAAAGRRVMVHPDDLPASPAGPVDAALRTLRPLTRAVSSGDGYAVFQTSGASGESKYVMRSHGSVAGQAAHYAQGRTAGEPPQRGLLVHTMTHSSGHTTCAFALYLAAEVAVTARRDHEASLAEVRALAPHWVITTERVVRSLLQQAEADPARRALFGPGPTRVVLTGQPIDPAIVSRLVEEGVDAQECYGTQETGLLALTPARGWRPDGSCRILPDVEVRLAEDGEALVRSPRGMVGYVGEPAAAQMREAFTGDGFYRTGDYVAVSGDGVLRVTGRKRDILRVHDGSLVYPARLEAMIASLDWVQQVALVGDQRPYLAALIVVRGEPRPGADDGFLDPDEHRALHDRARRDLAALNARLESTERIRLVALFDRPMEPSLYGPASSGEVRRDRPRIVAAYARRITPLYAAPPGQAPTWVPDTREAWASNRLVAMPMI